MMQFLLLPLLLSCAIVSTSLGGGFGAAAASTGASSTATTPTPSVVDSSPESRCPRGAKEYTGSTAATTATGTDSGRVGFEVRPIPGGPAGWSPAEVFGANLGRRRVNDGGDDGNSGTAAAAAMTEDEFRVVRNALRKHGLLVFRDQGDLDPSDAAAFVRRFDPASNTVWRDQKTNPWERHKADYGDGNAGTFQLPLHPESLALGTGFVRDHYGLTAFLGGNRRAYGSNVTGSQVIGGGKLQWHVDGAFWPTSFSSGLPCRVTGMRCVRSPSSDDAVVEIDYGDGSVLSVPKGSTVFASGRLAFDLLTPGEQDRALRTTVTYSEHPFKRFAHLGMTPDGLRCVDKKNKKGKNTASEEDDDDDDDAFGRLSAEDRAVSKGRLTLPLVWADDENDDEHGGHEHGGPALMPHTRCLESMTVYPASRRPEDGDGDEGGVVVLDAETSRSYLHGLMRRAIDPEDCYAHRWRSGDFAVWDNRGLWHSATGGLDPERDVRLMHLIAFDGSEPPRGCRNHRLRRLRGSNRDDPPDDDDAGSAAADAPRRRSGGGSGRNDEPTKDDVDDEPTRDAAVVRKTASILALVIGQAPRPDLTEPFREALSERLGPDTDVEITTVGALDGADDGVLDEAVIRKHNDHDDDHDGGGGEDNSCPLVTRLSDGRGVTVSEAVLAPLLERKMADAVRERADDPRKSGDPFVCAVLLCAGSFPTLRPGGTTTRAASATGAAGAGTTTTTTASMTRTPTPTGSSSENNNNKSNDDERRLREQIALPPLLKPFEVASATLAALLGVGNNNNNNKKNELVLFVPNEEQRGFAEKRWSSRLGSSSFGKIRAVVLPEEEEECDAGLSSPSEGIESNRGEAAAAASDAESGSADFVLRFLREEHERQRRRQNDDHDEENLVLVLDYVGHPPCLGDRIRQSIAASSRLGRNTVVLDVGSAAVQQVAALVRSQQ